MKDIKHIITIALLFMSAVAIAFLLTCCDNGDPRELDKPIGQSTNLSKSDTKSAKVELKPYAIQMTEKPDTTLWEFVYSVDKNENIKLADITDNAIHPDVYIHMYREESNLESTYNYYLQITSNIPEMPNATVNYNIPVTEDTIDEIWLVIEASTIMYNTIVEYQNMDLETYDATSWVSLYDHIVAALDEYQVRGFAATEMTVAAAMDEDDWLAAFFSRRMNEMYDEYQSN